MATLDITTIILAVISVVSNVLSALFALLRRKEKREDKTSKEQWELTNKLINNLLKKQSAMCKTLTTLAKSNNKKGKK